MINHDGSLALRMLPIHLCLAPSLFKSQPHLWLLDACQGARKGFLIFPSDKCGNRGRKIRWLVNDRNTKKTSFPKFLLLNVFRYRLSSYPKGHQPWIFIGRPDAKAEAPILWPPDSKSWLIEKDPDVGKDWGQEERRATEDEIVGWHHWLNGHEFEPAPGESERQGSLVCCSSCSRRVRHDLATEQQTATSYNKDA